MPTYAPAHITYPSAAWPFNNVIFVAPEQSTTLRDALARAALIDSRTYRSHVLLQLAPGVYGDPAVDLVIPENVEVESIGGGCSSAAADQTTGAGAAEQPTTILCRNLLCTPQTANAIQGLKGVHIVQSETSSSIDMSGAPACEWRTVNTVWDQNLQVSGQPASTVLSTWRDVGSFYAKPIAAFNANTRWAGLVAIDQVTQGLVGGGVGVSAVGQFMGCSMQKFGTATTNGADGSMTFVARGGSIIERIDLDNRVDFDGRKNRLPTGYPQPIGGPPPGHVYVVGDGGGSSYNCDARFMYVTTTGGGAKDYFYWIDDTLPVPKGMPYILGSVPTISIIAFSGTDTDPPPLEAEIDEIRFALTDSVMGGRQFIVCAVLPDQAVFGI